MKDLIRTVLGIISIITVTIFLILSLFGLIPILSPENSRTLMFIFVGILTIMVLESASRMHEDEKKDKDKNKKFEKEERK